MSYKKSKYFLTSSKTKIKYSFFNEKNQIIVVFFHGFMSDMAGKNPTQFKNFAEEKE